MVCIVVGSKCGSRVACACHRPAHLACLLSIAAGRSLEHVELAGGHARRPALLLLPALSTNKRFIPCAGAWSTLSWRPSLAAHWARAAPSPSPQSCASLWSTGLTCWRRPVSGWIPCAASNGLRWSANGSAGCAEELVHLRMHGRRLVHCKGRMHRHAPSQRHARALICTGRRRPGH